MKIYLPVTPISGNSEEYNAPYTLVLKDARFEPSHDEPEMIDEDAISHFNEKLQRLRKIFGYTNARQSELEASFNIKPLFILGRAIPNSHAGEAIMLLVADKDLFFKDGDKIRRSQDDNSEFVSTKKHVERDLKKPAEQENSIQRQLIALSLQDWFHSPTSEQRLIAEKILLAVINEAASLRIGVRRWLYSREHAKVGASNIDYYKRAYSRFPDGYEDAERVFPEDEREREKFIATLLDDKYVIFPEASEEEAAKEGKAVKEENLFYRNRDMLNVEICGRDFERLVPECADNSSCSMEFYEKVIWCLGTYISQERLIKTPLEEERSYIDPERIRKNYPVFQKRYQRICALEDKFSHATRSWTEQMGKDVAWGANVNSKSPQTSAIVQAIINYLTEINRKIRDAEFLSNRIEWILHPSGKWKFLDDDALKPMLILAFVLGGRMTQYSEITSTPAKAFRWSKHISKEKQRLAQIRLLDALHTALNLPQDLQAKSWNEYFLLQGKDILSLEELEFWRDKLQTNYEALPIIGFQLCFLDFCNDCMSPHLEPLSYVSIDEIQKLEFYEFHQRNLSEIHALSERLSNHQDVRVQKIIQRYCRLWKSSESANEEQNEKRRKAILPLRELLQNDTRLFNVSQPDGILYLSIEAAIRLAVIKKAREKLVLWFDKTYLCSIKKLQVAFTPKNAESVVET